MKYYYKFKYSGINTSDVRTEGNYEMTTTSKISNALKHEIEVRIAVEKKLKNVYLLEVDIYKERK